MLFRQLSYCMTLILFTVFAGKTCSAVSLLPQDFYANFTGDPLQVTHRMICSCGKFYTAIVLRAVLYITALPKEQRV